ncbi:MAG TPA: nucleoside-diphosphate sugar epimerase/dehydratase [Trebonia sp.]|jgi:FlaA1/EpsC-like NDP-sugar epimerase|nr:nucleoside-diphosphate sugar epimerase/dehydratase [Trebonia sp.]
MRGYRRLSRAAAEAGCDAAVWVTGLCLAAWATRDLPTGAVRAVPLCGSVLLICAVSVLAGLLAGLYQGRWQRGSLDEIVCVAVAGGVTLGVVAVVCGPVSSGPLAGSGLLLTGHRELLQTVSSGGLIALPTLATARYVLGAARQRRRKRSATGVKVIVFGGGEAGTALISRLLGEPDAAYRPVAILDDDPDKRRLRVHGVQVLGDRNRMAEVAAATGATVLVIAIVRASGRLIADLTAQAERCGLTPKVVPTVTEMLSGGARIEGVRDPRITDLLGRRPIQTDVAAIAGHFRGKRVLVTGAGGSIGSELCRQLHAFQPAELIMLDRDESALHQVQLSLHGRALLDSDETVLADIRDPRRIREVFERFRPQIVFHAAALKHLPLIERFPAEALQSNVLGTLTVLEAAAASGTESFVNISTDKAADPVSVLGYSKRIAERLTAHMADQVAGSCLSVRFGNVLGSRGSVLGTLSAQVAAGGPVTVTHPDVTRYFMTADEAVQLVLQAAVIGSSGEVLILDMGEPVRIADIARRLCARSNRRVEIVYTGLRPGEKLTEDLLGADEVDYRPRHPLVRHAKVVPIDPALLSRLAVDADEASLRRDLAELATGPWRSARPAQGDELMRELVQEDRGGLVPTRGSAGRVGHVVHRAAPQQAVAVPVGADPGQPGPERLAWAADAGLASPADELAQRERSLPGVRQQDHGVPDVIALHPDDEVRVGDVFPRQRPAPVSGDVLAPSGHDGDDLRGCGLGGEGASHPGG